MGLTGPVTLHRARAACRDGVMDRAVIADENVLLDFGTGDGLIGLTALERVLKAT